MIFGVFERRADARPDPARLVAAARTAGGAVAPGDEQRLTHGSIGLMAWRDPRAGALRPATTDDGALCAAATGSIYNAPELAKRCDLSLEPGDDAALARLMLALYRREGEDFVGLLNGRFAFALWEAPAERLLLGRDRLGIDSLYVALQADRVAFGSAIAPLLAFGAAPRELDPAAIGRFLLFNYNLGFDTLFRGVRRLRPGHLLEVTREVARERRYWNLRFDPSERAGVPAERVAEELVEGLRAAVRRRVSDPLGDATPPGVFVSGGMDSSSVLGLLREAREGEIQTFSYRCRGEGFDESHYARRMAESVGAANEVAEYGAEDILQMGEAVREMNEPFCDVGINIATWILGRRAEGRITSVLTGDGGDELFGGHPIYEADKIARFVDPIPSVLKAPFLAAFRALPDSDQKKNLTVKLKRFAESLSLPAELLSHRWRTYYDTDELAGGVLTPSLWEQIEPDALYGDLLAIHAQCDGPDGLSRSLQSDYQTVVDFYLRRNDLIRRFGIEARYPLFDHELVELCAAIPTKHKIRGWFDTKWVLRLAMEDLLPHEIVHRGDKLGHSIPLKNWIRDDETVRSFVLDHLDDASVRRRGLVRPEFVQRQIEEHMARRRNNSHRLWTLAVLEMWMRAHVDRGRV